mmetsp:Transcript_17203/g.41695  ORF Transcript_17203/g.41695 Transcript_17203/m.41695 type:complete len:200 (-) Transcript_17203:279-878(-)
MLHPSVCVRCLGDCYAALRGLPRDGGAAAHQDVGDVDDRRCSHLHDGSHMFGGVGARCPGAPPRRVAPEAPHLRRLAPRLPRHRLLGLVGREALSLALLFGALHRKRRRLPPLLHDQPGSEPRRGQDVLGGGGDGVGAAVLVHHICPSSHPGPHPPLLCPGEGRERRPRLRGGPRRLPRSRRRLCLLPQQAHHPAHGGG